MTPDISREDLEYIWDVCKGVFPSKESYINCVLASLKKEDEKIRKAIINYFYETHDDDEERAMFITWLEKQGKQKAVEPNYVHHKVDLSDCSEEYIKAYYDGWNNCNQQHEQLKAEQKPTEWSEEDEKMLDDIILDCSYCGDFPDYPTKEESELYDECLKKVDWLKSLRPQKQWKPSEEQIKALSNAKDDCFGDTYEILDTLCRQLKEL